MICTYLYNKRVGPSFAHHFRGHSWTVLDRPEAVEDSAFAEGGRHQEDPQLVAKHHGGSMQGWFDSTCIWWCRCAHGHAVEI